MLSFKPTFSLFFTFIKRLFSSSLSVIREVSSAYLRLLIFLPAILINTHKITGIVVGEAGGHPGGYHWGNVEGVNGRVTPWSTAWGTT